MKLNYSIVCDPKSDKNVLINEKTSKAQHRKKLFIFYLRNPFFNCAALIQSELLSNFK